MSVLTLWLPILLAAVAVFFASFLSWMVLQLHKHDWRKLPNEDEFFAGVGRWRAELGSYMFPGVSSPQDFQSPDFQRKSAAGPWGVITFFPKVNMGRNLGLTMLFFLAVNFCLAYLATLALQPGAEFARVFRFVATAGLMTYLAGIVPHAIWFRIRIVGHVLESVAFAAISGVVFALLWPKA